MVEIIQSKHFILQTRKYSPGRVFKAIWIVLCQLTGNRPFTYYYFSFSFYGLEVPRLGVESELQLRPTPQATATTTLDLSCICDLCHNLQQCQILNAECGQGSNLHPHRDNSGSLTCRATTATPGLSLTKLKPLFLSNETVKMPQFDCPWKQFNFFFLLSLRQFALFPCYFSYQVSLEQGIQM